MPVGGIEIYAHRQCWRVGQLAEKHWQPLMDAAIGHTAETDSGLVQLIAAFPSGQCAEFAHRLLRISPHSPLAKATLIEHDWKSVEKRAADWEKSARRQPAVLEALGKRYSAAGRDADAERCLKAAVEAAPGVERSLALAEVYRKQGKMDLWQATLEKCLDQPDYGLSHASVCNDLAKHFMDRREWDKALPFAEGAAESYSAWGLETAANCHEALQHWKEAEYLYQAVSQRYRGQESPWYYFCKRTGYGDLKPARELVRTAISAGAQVPSSGCDDDFMAPMYYLLEKQPEKALPLLEASFQKGGDPYDGILIALANDQLKRSGKLDAVFQEIKTRGPKYENSQTGKSAPRVCGPGGHDGRRPQERR